MVWLYDRLVVGCILLGGGRGLKGSSRLVVRVVSFGAGVSDI